MDEKRKSLPGAKPEGIEKRDCANDRANDRKARFQYSALRLDDKLPDDFSRLHRATPEPRVCVYGVPESIPFYRGRDERYS